jgi:LacI family xylobiose transport system transcriptional regulator
MSSNSELVPTTTGQALTIAQIADRAGVSIATVSKVVNGRSNVSSETRGLVETVIQQHGYRRQRRPAQPAPLLDLVINVLGGEYAMEIIVGVDRVARKSDIAVAVAGLQGGQAPGQGWLEGVLARRSMGVIAVFCAPTVAQREQLRAREVPLVVVDPVSEPGGAFPSVATNNWNGGLAATQHLLGLGHRRIGVIAGPADALAGRARFDGFRAAMDAAGVPVDPALLCGGGFQIEEGADHARRLLALANPPTAIFACSDGYAVGVYQAAFEGGVHIPQDLSVVGFDDIPPAAWLSPALTTVRQPITDMAAEAAEMVLTLARGEPLARSRVVLAAELVVRASTAPPGRDS